MNAEHWLKDQILEKRNIKAPDRIAAAVSGLGAQPVPVPLAVHAELTFAGRPERLLSNPRYFKPILYHTKKLAKCIPVSVRDCAVIIIDLKLIRREEDGQEEVVLLCAGKARISSSAAHPNLHCGGGPVMAVRDIEMRDR